MVNQRQRLARKRYKEANPELFPKPEPTPPKDPDRKKKKTKSKFKRKKAESKAPNDPSKPIRKGFNKHPLRVPGMKPGESCFICKAKNNIATLCPDKHNWQCNKVFFFFFFFFFFFSVLDFALQVLWNLKICADLVSCTVGSVFFLQAVNNQAILCLNFMQLSV
jgi:hypothetical protein